MDVFHDPQIEQIRTEDLLGDYPSVRYAPPDESFYMDILTRLGEAFAFSDLETARVPFDGLSHPSCFGAADAERPVGRTNAIALMAVVT